MDDDDGEERDRGVLTPADRRFINNGGAHLGSDQSRRNARRRIRKRIHNAVLDFAVIMDSSEDRDLNQVMESLDAEDVQPMAAFIAYIESRDAITAEKDRILFGERSRE